MKSDVLADTIVRLFDPANVLHVGLTNTDLIEELIIRGVPAFGVTTQPVDFSHTADVIANRVFIADSYLFDDIMLPQCDLIVTDGYLDQLPEEDLHLMKLFMEVHGDRHYFRVRTRKRPLIWWDQWMKAFYESVA